MTVSRTSARIDSTNLPTPWARPWPGVQGRALAIEGRIVAAVVLAPSGGAAVAPLLNELDEHQRVRAKTMKREQRRDEYVLTRWLLKRWREAGTGPFSEGDIRPAISHSRTAVAVALADGATPGLDIECRAPRDVGAVAEHLGWPAGVSAFPVCAWTAWEAWCKWHQDSVLDPPSPGYERALAALGRAWENGGIVATLIDGHAWLTGPAPTRADPVATQPWFSLVVKA